MSVSSHYPDFATHQALVRGMMRPSPDSAWYLLELPNGMFAAFWHAGYEHPDYVQSIAEGKYRDVCAYRSRSRDRVLKYIAANPLS